MMLMPNEHDAGRYGLLWRCEKSNPLLSAVPQPLSQFYQTALPCGSLARCRVAILAVLVLEPAASAEALGELYAARCMVLEIPNA
jgi:hypothetical protein